MTRLMNELWRDECGLVVSAELVIVATVGVLAMVVGINAVASSVNQELNDVAGAIGAIDQTYSYQGFVNPNNGGGWGFGFGGGGAHAFVSGSGYVDGADLCDCSEVVPVRSGMKAGGGARESIGGAVQPSAPAPTPATPSSPCPTGDCPSSSAVPALPCPTCTPSGH